MRTARFDDAVAAALDEAARRRLLLIARCQDRQTLTLAVRAGQSGRAQSRRMVGIGVQVFTERGWCGFAASDDWSPRAVRELIRQADGMARASGSFEPDANHAAFALEPGERRVLPRIGPSATPRVEALLAALRDANGALADLDGIVVRSRCSIVDDEWRIVRSDGTDVSFALTHANPRHDLTGLSEPIAVTASAWGRDGSVLFDADAVIGWERRARRVVAHARAALGAPALALGSANVVIDARLAKGLAHEAFGHGCETDVAPISVLATDGRLRIGERVGPEHVSILDEPLHGDPASQPISANGLVRQPVEIVRAGLLAGGLGDLFSSGAAGVPITGACRAESYRERPTPRMTNTRIVVDRTLALDGDAEDPPPEVVAAALRSAGLWRVGESTLYLTGYRGGQAHPSQGDFVFASAATYDLSDDCAPRRPAVLSGRTESVLWAIQAGLGKLQIDTVGLCGKNGANVVSSGGSHALLVLGARADLKVGGG